MVITNSNNIVASPIKGEEVLIKTGWMIHTSLSIFFRPFRNGWRR